MRYPVWQRSHSVRGKHEARHLELFFSPTWNEVRHSLRIDDRTLNIKHLYWGHYILLDDLVSFLHHCPNLWFHVNDGRHYNLHEGINTFVLRELRLVRDISQSNSQKQSL